MMKATIPAKPENERDLNDQMCIGNFTISAQYTSNCNYSTSGFSDLTSKMQRFDLNITPIDLNISNADYLSDLFQDSSGKGKHTKQFFFAITIPDSIIFRK
jgi:hypothetical protein